MASRKGPRAGFSGNGLHDFDTMKHGDKIKDNDPRMGYRVLTITHVQQDDCPHVLAKSRSGRTFRILKSRIFNDGKHRRSGFSLLVKPERDCQSGPDTVKIARSNRDEANDLTDEDRAKLLRWAKTLING